MNASFCDTSDQPFNLYVRQKESSCLNKIVSLETLHFETSKKIFNHASQRQGCASKCTNLAWFYLLHNRWFTHWIDSNRLGLCVWNWLSNLCMCYIPFSDIIFIQFGNRLKSVLQLIPQFDSMKKVTQRRSQRVHVVN